MSGHHISSRKILIATAAALVVLTGLTVAMHYIHIPQPYAIMTAMAIAVVKAGIVALFFMNLYWDTRFNSMLLVSAILFLALLVGLSMIDTMFRTPVTPSF